MPVVPWATPHPRIPSLSRYRWSYFPGSAPRRGPEPDPERQRLGVTDEKHPDGGVPVGQRNGGVDRRGWDTPQGH